MEIKTPILKCFFEEHLNLKKEILDIINSSEADIVDTKHYKLQCL